MFAMPGRIRKNVKLRAPCNRETLSKLLLTRRSQLKARVRTKMSRIKGHGPWPRLRAV
jgi:hypothetical protein